MTTTPQDKALCIIPNCGKHAPADDPFCAEHRGGDMTLAEQIARIIEPMAWQSDNWLGLRDISMSKAEQIIAIVREEAAKVCEEQAQDFLSEQYATPQPIGSITERFACGECASAIRKLGSASPDPVVDV